MQHKLRFHIICLVMLLCVVFAYQSTPLAYTPTHYVTADAEGGGDGSIGDPWTLDEAMINAVAGNVVRVAPGVYTASLGSDRWAPGFGLRNDGTASNPIVIYAQNPASQLYDDANFETLRSELRNDGTAINQHPVIGTWGFDDGAKYATIDGFYINGAVGYAPFASSGGAVMASTRGHFTIKNFAFDMYHISADDNYVAIFTQPNGEAAMSGPITIENNLFVGGSGAGNHNASCITTYYTQNLLIQNNEFRGVNNGIYVKGANNGGIIRYNKSTDASLAFVNINSVGDDLEVLVYQNIVVNPGQEGVFWGNSPPATRRGARVYNNTIIADDPGGGWIRLDGYQSYTDQQYYNNIMAAVASNSQVFVNAWESSGYTSVGGFSPFDYNLYYNNGGTISNALNGAIYSGMANWRTASSRDANSITDNPNFVDASAGNYRLASGSAALTASSTGGPIGAYITGSEVIGIDSNGGGEEEPPATTPTISGATAVGVRINQ